MLSLGYFYQSKKLSLEAQEAEAHGAFLRIIDLMRSAKPVDQVEAINLCGQICSRFASPTIVNSAFMRMAEAFRTGSNTLQLEILRMVQKNIQHLPKIRSHSEFIRPIFTVIYSNDPVARAITLRLLAAIAVSIPNQLDVHHAVRVALRSKDRNELQAALFACRNLARISGKFAEEIAADIVVLVERPGLSDDERIAALQIIPYIAGLRLDTKIVTGAVAQILQDGAKEQYQSSTVIQTALRTISDLLVRSADSGSIREHILTLISFVHKRQPEFARPAASELLRFFRMCSSQLEPAVLSEICLRLLQSGRQHAVNQGIECVHFLVIDPLTCCNLDALDPQVTEKITDCAFRRRSVWGACAFAVVCKITAKLCSKSSGGENLSSILVERLTSVERLCDAMFEFLEEIKDSAERLRMLKFIRVALSPANLCCFPVELRNKCLQFIPRFSFPGPACQLLYLKHLRDVIAVDSKLVSEFLDRSTWISTLSDCDPDTKFRILFHVVALRFQLSSHMPDMVVNEEQLAGEILAFDLSHWDVYRLARCGLADGRYAFSASVLGFIRNYTHSAETSNWINMLFSLAQSEVAKDSLRGPAVTVATKSETIDKIVLSQMDVSLQLNCFCGPNRLGIFRKKFLDLRTNVTRVLLQLVNTIEQIRISASDMKDPSSILMFASAKLAGPLTKLKLTADDAFQCYRLTFDADETSQTVLRFYFELCASLGTSIAAATHRSFTVAETLVGPLVQLRGSSIMFNRLKTLVHVVSDNASLYAWLKELFQISTYFLTFPVPLPRYFFQQFQQTTLAMILTPPPAVEKDYVQTINMETRFTLKIDGMLSADWLDGKTAMRKVKMVRLITTVNLVKSLPFSSKVLSAVEVASDGMAEDIHLDGLSFFSHTFVMNLGYPGVYRIDVDSQFHDQDDVAWSAMQTTSLTVRVVESFGMLRKGGNMDVLGH